MESYFKMGCFMFSGGHMIAPLLLAEYSKDNLIEEAEILQGMALTSLTPGPIANISGYIGTLINGIFGGLLASVFLFLPGILIALGSIKYIESIKKMLHLQYFLKGVCSAAVGILITAIIKFWYDSCFVNPYSHIHLGTMNIVLCYIFLDKFSVPIPFVLIFGSMFSFYSFLFVSNFFYIDPTA
jgi:chromate transporter